MHRGGLLEEFCKLVGVGFSNRGGVEGTEPLLNLERTRKRDLHRNLLVEQHANE